MIKRKQG